MTCSGDDADCREALQRVYEYLDGEMAAGDLARIRQHLEDCRPCLDEYDLDVALKALVRRSCSEQAPAQLRQRILVQLTEVRIELQG